MSWDIVVVDIPPHIKSVRDIPKGLITPSLGKRAEIIDKIKAIIPAANFPNPDWGLINGPGWSIEVRLGETKECSSFSLYLRGGDGAFRALVAILEGLNLRAIDCQTSEFFDAGKEGMESFEQWKEYRDRVLALCKN
jgi:hypothetical protein